ncbi:hypothetical protein D3C85_1471280 [compost metagenome]
MMIEFHLDLLYLQAKIGMICQHLSDPCKCSDNPDIYRYRGFTVKDAGQHRYALLSESFWQFPQPHLFFIGCHIL